MSPPVPEAGVLRSEAGPEFDLEGHRVVLDEGTTVAYQRASGSVDLRLEAGAVACEVRPLRDEGVFTLRSPHAFVRVVGTEFRVEVDDRCTRVRVDHGTVRVAPLAVDEATVELTVGQGREFCRPAPSPDPSPERPSEDELMRSALDASASGRREEALRQFQQYRTWYPEGRFVEDATFHEAVLAARSGDRERAQRLLEALGRQFPDSPRRGALEDLLNR
jgi:hypothetical protein